MKQCSLCLPSPPRQLYEVQHYIAPAPQIKKKHPFQVHMNHTLYFKYSSSQNYFYAKEINEILAHQRTPAVIDYNDYVCLDECEEFLKRYYYLDEYQGKIHLLAEFYKFHRDLPRWSIEKRILRLLNYHYDKKRRLEYYKIQRMIEQENQKNPGQPAKGIVGDKPLESYSTPASPSSETVNVNLNVDNILHDITQHNNNNNNEKSINLQRPYVPALDLSLRNNSSDIQQIISMLSIQNSVCEKDKEIKPKKKKIMQKKSLKLDDVALSQRIEQKLPLSARYQPLNTKLLDQCIDNVAKLTSRSIKRDKSKDLLLKTLKLSPDLLKKITIKSPPKLKPKPPTPKEMGPKQTPREMAFKTTPRERENLNAINKKHQPTQSNQQKKNINANQDIKKLEMKVLKGLQDFQKIKTAKLFSFDQKSLLTLVKKQKQKSKVKPTNQSDTIEFKDTKPNLDFKYDYKPPPQQIQTPRVGKLDLKKLNQLLPSSKNPQVQSARTTQKSNISSRHNSLHPLTPRMIDRKLQSINNLMQWQMKAIEAASREYNLIKKN